MMTIRESIDLRRTARRWDKRRRIAQTAKNAALTIAGVTLWSLVLAALVALTYLIGLEAIDAIEAKRNGTQLGDACPVWLNSLVQ